MHKLVRQVRFTINPFLDEDEVGANSFASKPCGEGFGIFLELGIGLVGRADESTGFVINVVEIDRIAREIAVPIFSESIRGEFRGGRHMGFAFLSELLARTAGSLRGKFGGALVGELSLKLNPYRKISIDCEDFKMIYFSEKFEFAAMHKLWNEELSSERNFAVFGKCSNPAGHGHNYVVEVTVKSAAEKKLAVGDFEKIVDSELINLIDHKNLNVDVERFGKINPTVENIAVFAWEKLDGKFEDVKLHCVSVWETDKTYCSYYG